MNKLLIFALLTVLLCLDVMAQNPTFTVVSFDGQNIYYNDNSGKLKSIAVTPIQMTAPPSGSCTGDLISIQFTTQASEVLAGVQASLIIE